MVSSWAGVGCRFKAGAVQGLDKDSVRFGVCQYQTGGVRPNAWGSGVQTVGFARGGRTTRPGCTAVRSTAAGRGKPEGGGAAAPPLSRAPRAKRRRGHGGERAHRGAKPPPSVGPARAASAAGRAGPQRAPAEGEAHRHSEAAGGRRKGGGRRLPRPSDAGATRGSASGATAAAPRQRPSREHRRNEHRSGWCG